MVTTISLAVVTFVLGVVSTQAFYSRILLQYEGFLENSRRRAEEYKEWYEKESEKARRYYGYWMGKKQASREAIR